MFLGAATVRFLAPPKKTFHAQPPFSTGGFFRNPPAVLLSSLLGMPEMVVGGA